MVIWRSELYEGSGHRAGLALLERLYRETTGRALPPMVRDPGGKPRFLDSPWHFSISHTPKTVFCALADRPVGIDAEERSRIVPEKLAQRILSPSEYAQFAAAEDKNTALLTFWVLKEAAAKASGRGIQYPENRTEFSLSDPRVFTEKGCLAAIITEENYAL